MNGLYGYKLSRRLVFPLLIASAAANQPRPMPLLMVLGQMLSIGSILAAAVVLVGTFPKRRWPLLLVGATVLLRAARSVIGEGPAEFAYTLAGGTLFAAVGAVVAITSARMLHRQVLLFCLLSVPLMTLQVLGVGAWTQMLRTDFHQSVEEELAQHPTLFVDAVSTIVNTTQSRPAGFLHANNYLSIILLFAIALHFGRPTRRRVTWWDVVLCATAVLSMAKIVFLSLAVVWATVAVSGNTASRRYVVKSVLLHATALGGYSFLFPGLWAFNFEFEYWLVNLQLRLVDLLFATGNPTLIDMAYLMPDWIVKRVDPSQATQSGYASIARYIPVLLVGLMAVAPMFWTGWRQLRRADFRWIEATRLMVVVLGLTPLVTSFFGSMALWFFAGFAVLPLALVVEPQYGLLLAEAAGVVDHPSNVVLITDLAATSTNAQSPVS